MSSTPPRALQAAAEAYAACPTERNADACARAARPYVRQVANRFKVPDGHALASRSDLEQVGLMGLVEALSTYDPARGTAFASFAYARVRGAITDYLRSVDVLSPSERERSLRFSRAVHELEQQLQEEPTSLEVAEHLGVSLEEYHRDAMAGAARFSLLMGTAELPPRYAGTTKAFSRASGGRDARLDGLPDLDAACLDGEVDRARISKRLAVAISTLPRDEQNLITLHYYEGLTLSEAGASLGKSRQRAAQVLSRALFQLRNRLASTHD